MEVSFFFVEAGIDFAVANKQRDVHKVNGALPRGDLPGKGTIG